MNPTPPTLVFVYGTLKRSGVNHHLLAGQSFVGEARTVRGFRIYDLGNYPGMVAAQDDQDGVSGEVWSVDTECLARLDAFEGVSEQLYTRGRVPLIGPLAGVEVEGYLYARSTAGTAIIQGGSWRNAVGPA